MLLTGPEIQRQVDHGNILIEPFDPACVGPNSYDVHLGNYVYRLMDRSFDVTQPLCNYDKLHIPNYGLTLLPHEGYLGFVVERIQCHGFVPWIDGRSTIGRYFLQCHQTAGRGDDGWDGQFTLEMLATVRPVVVYAGLPIAQVSFFKLEGRRQPYAGRYNRQEGPTLPKPFSLKT